jgi:transposase InsO family protein
MSGFRPMPGSEFTLHAKRYTVESYDSRRGCVTVVDTDGVLTTKAVDDLVHHTGLRLPGQHRRARLVNTLERLPEDQKQAALARIEHVTEAMTGFRCGSASQAQPGEPKPEYNPLTTLQCDRLAAKRRELDNEFARRLGVSMSERTMRRLWADIRAGNAFASAAGASAKRYTAGRRIHPDVIEATIVLIEDQRAASSKSISTLFLELRARLLESRGKPWLNEHLPSERTWRRFLDDRWTKSELNGKARTRASNVTAPKGGFRRTNPTRPGQLVLMDTNNLDVLLAGTAIEGAVRGSLVMAMDAFSRSICAVRVVEQTEKNLDVGFAFLDVARPKQMLPGWPSEARWPFVGIPDAVLDDMGVDLPHGASGMPFVNPEALVTDNGATYRAHKTRDLCRRFGVDLLPARAYTPSDKASIERAFGALRSSLLERLDGYRGSDTSERGKNVDAEVEWTAQRLEDLISLWVVTWWQNHTLDDVKPAWCPEGDWTPNSLYLLGLETSGLAPKMMSTDDYLSVLGSTQVKVHSRGVNIKGLWYDGPLLDGRRNNPAPTMSKKWKVHFDVRDLRHVWFVDENENTHQLRWVGMTGDFPAFSDRHLNALRKRVPGRLRTHDQDELAYILIDLLQVRDADGFIAEKPQTAAASKHARDQEKATHDAKQYAAPTPPPASDTEGALERKRAVKREAAVNTDKPVTSAPPMVAKGGSIFGDMSALKEDLA